MLLRNMDEANSPPIIGEPPVVEAAPAVSRWRWWIHLIVLTALPVTVGVLGLIPRNGKSALLPRKVSSLLMVTAEQLIVFAAFFVLAWAASRANRRQLLLPWRGGWMTLVRGAAYSIVLRILIVVVATTAVVLWLLLRTALKQGQPSELTSGALRPHIENLFNPDALNNPFYFALMLTLVSFVLGGLREELWRAGMFAGFEALFPRLMIKRAGKAVAVLIVAALFGLAHTPQGWAGVAVITLLGAGLGAIMLWHRSLWEAALAHGFFDATTFVFIYVAVKYFPHDLPGF